MVLMVNLRTIFKIFDVLRIWDQWKLIVMELIPRRKSRLLNFTGRNIQTAEPNEIPIHHGILPGDRLSNRQTLVAKRFETQSHPDTC